MCAHKIGRNGLGYYVSDRLEPSGGLVEPSGRWMGRLAQQLNLDDRLVDASSLSTVLDATDLASGDALFKGAERRRIVGFDVVLAAPKSVSIVLALGEEATALAVRAAHEASVEACVEYLERNVAFVQRQLNRTRSVVESDGLVVAGFVHRTSRAPDPHLHTHLLVANLGRDPDGKWSALDARELFTHIRAASALYGAHLRYELSTEAELHFAPRRSGVIDLLGVREGTITLFSRRSLEVAAALEERGFVGRRASQLASDLTRKPKDVSIPWEGLVELWRDRAGRAGLSTESVQSFGQRSWGVDEPWSSISPDPVDIIERFDRPFTRRELTTTLADRTIDGAHAREIEAQVDLALASSAARSRPATYYLPDTRGRTRIPRSVPEPRWASARVAEILDRTERMISSAARAEPGSDLSSLLVSTPVVIVDDTIASLSALRREGSRIQSFDRSVVAVAPTAALAGHFAAMTGIETAPQLAPGRLGSDGLLVIYAPGSIAPDVMAVALDWQKRTGLSMILVDRTIRELGRVPEPISKVNSPRHRITGKTEVPPSIEVRFISDAGALRSAVLAVAQEWRRRGHDAVIVTSEAIDPLETSGIPVVGSRHAAELARGDRTLAAVVVGDGRVLGASAHRAFGLRRTHLVVEPIEPLGRAAVDVSIGPRRLGRARDRVQKDRAQGR